MQYIWQYLGAFLKIPALSIPQLFFISRIAQRQFFTLVRDLILVP